MKKRGAIHIFIFRFTLNKFNKSENAKKKVQIRNENIYFK